MTYRFYTDLAAWWPLISPPEEYEEEAAFIATVLGSASIPILTGRPSSPFGRSATPPQGPVEAHGPEG